jgi:hypothetical protein
MREIEFCVLNVPNVMQVWETAEVAELPAGHWKDRNLNREIISWRLATIRAAKEGKPMPEKKQKFNYPFINPNDLTNYSVTVYSPHVYSMGELNWRFII